MCVGGVPTESLEATKPLLSVVGFSRKNKVGKCSQLLIENFQISKSLEREKKPPLYLPLWCFSAFSVNLAAEVVCAFRAPDTSCRPPALGFWGPWLLRLA